MNYLTVDRYFEDMGIKYAEDTWSQLLTTRQNQIMFNSSFHIDLLFNIIEDYLWAKNPSFNFLERC